MQIPIIISIAALIFSATSLAFSIYNILRDRGKLRVWSELYYDRSKDPENPPPSLKIIMVNAGRRPIVLTSFVKLSPSMTWYSPLNYPSLPTNEKGYLNRLPTMEDFAAQNTCLVLKEGEVFEYIIEHGDDFELFTLIDDDIHYANKLYVQDVLKRRYYVKKSHESIEKLFKFEKEPNKSMQPTANASAD